VSRIQAIRSALMELEHETVTHLNEWGPENPSDGTGGVESERGALVFRRACIEAFAEGRGTWRALAMDRLMNAFSEARLPELRDAIMDAAGLLVAWAVDLEQRPKDAPRDAPGARPSAQQSNGARPE